MADSSEIEPNLAKLSVGAPVAGLVVALGDVPDAAFAGEALGPGIAIEPLESVICAPCDGEIIAVARTLHAVTLRATNGAEVLIHTGIDTVALAGEGFELLVEVGADIVAGTPLIRFDYEAVVSRAKSLCTPIIITNGEDYDICNTASSPRLALGDAMMEITRKRAAGRPDTGVLEASGPSVSEQIVIELALGIHARPAAQIARLAKTFAGRVEFGPADKRVDAKSTASMMGLGVRHGDEVTVAAHGTGSDAVVAKLIALIKSGAGDPVQPITANDDSKVLVAHKQPAKRDENGAYIGVTASGGMAIGRVYVHRPQSHDIPETVASENEESEALQTAIAVTQKAILIEARTANEEQAALLDAHAEIVVDPVLIHAASKRVKAGDSAGKAWQSAIAQQAQVLEAAGDPRIAERVADLKDLEARVFNALYGPLETVAAEEIEGAIIFAEDLLPSEFMRYSNAKLSGLCLAAGGVTSHVSILAGAANIPTLVALGDEILNIAPGTPAMINAAVSRLVIDPSSDEVGVLKARLALRQETEAEAALLAMEPARTTDGTRISVFANLSSVAEAANAVRLGAEGCGLLRTEFLFTDRASAPTTDEQALCYAAISNCLDKRSLTIRTLDIGGDKPVPFLNLGHEANPALGLRGIRTFLAHPDVMRAQVEAILTAAARGDIQIMLPMVSSPQEIVDFRAAVTEIAKDMEIEKIPPIGTMIETPASAVMAQQICRVADVVSIGTNDLTQYTLAMDRGQPALAGSIDGLHPAVVGLMARVGAAASTAEISAGVCGGLASDPIAVPILLGLGITKLSATLSMIAPIKAIVRSLDLQQCRFAAEKAQALNSPTEVRQLVLDEWPQLDRWL